MGLLLGARRSLLGLGGQPYFKKVLATGPIAYWPLDESAGTVARCLVNTAQNGTATGVTWANDHTGPFGTPAPYFDGANDYVNVQTATLAAAFNGSAGTAHIWWRVANAGVWTDAVERRPYTLQVNAQNYVVLTKSNVNNRILSIYAAGAVAETGPQDPYSNTNWVAWTMTWNKALDAVNYYLNGAWFEADNTLGVWAGALAQTVIGATSAIPANPWHGWLAHCVVWDRPLGAGEILALANP